MPRARLVRCQAPTDGIVTPVIHQCVIGRCRIALHQHKFTKLTSIVKSATADKLTAIHRLSDQLFQRSANPIILGSVGIYRKRKLVFLPAIQLGALKCGAYTRDILLGIFQLRSTHITCQTQQRTGISRHTISRIQQRAKVPEQIFKHSVKRNQMAARNILRSPFIAERLKEYFQILVNFRVFIGFKIFA